MVQSRHTRTQKKRVAGSSYGLGSETPREEYIVCGPERGPPSTTQFIR